MPQGSNNITHVPHDIGAEFPDNAATIHALKLSDAHFRDIADRYHDINREIHRIETDGEAASDARLEDLKKQRLAMLDETALAIAQVKRALT